MTRALVLSGGGAKGAYQVGVIMHLMGDLHREYDIFTGVSVGAINAAAVSQHLGTMTPHQASTWLRDFWVSTVKDNTSVYRKRFLWELAALWSTSAYSTKPLQRLVYENIDLDLLKGSGKKVAVGAVSLDTGDYAYGREYNPYFKDWILASAAFPIFLEPIKIDGQLWTDGGLKRVTPLAEAIRLGADEVDVIMCSNWELPIPWETGKKWQFWKRAAFPAQVLRIMKIYNDQILEMDIKITGMKNELAQANPKYRHVKINLIRPNKILMDDSLQFSNAEVKRLISLGYRDATNTVVV